MRQAIDTNGYMDIFLINTSTTDQLNRILIHTYYYILNHFEGKKQKSTEIGFLKNSFKIQTVCVSK